jgi:hypothetical protein
MQVIEPSSAQKYNTYTLNPNTLLIFEPNLKYEKYSCEWYHGIIFYVHGDGNFLTGEYGRYDVIHNIYLGNRLLISNSEGWKDIPFKKATFGFLPPGVEAIEL